MKVRMVVFLCVGPVPTHGQNTAWLRHVLQRKHSQNRQKAALLTGVFPAATEREAGYSLVRPPVCHSYFIYFEMKIILL